MEKAWNMKQNMGIKRNFGLSFGRSSGYVIAASSVLINNVGVKSSGFNRENQF